jgi:hypothetical protein
MALDSTLLLDIELAKNDAITEIDNHIPVVTVDIEAEGTVQKLELNDHELIKEGELNDHTVVKIQELDDKFDELKQDNGVIPVETVSINDLAYGRWWTMDITAFADAPTNLKVGDEQGTLEVMISDGRKLIKYFSVTGNILFKIESSVGIYTDWAETGVEANIAVVGNIGASFKFAPIIWDIATNNYILATPTSGADAIAVNGDTVDGLAYYDSRVKIPAGALDDLGDPFEDGHYYFLSQAVAGKFQKAKPTTGAWQPMFQVMQFNTNLYAMVEIATYEDITPIVYSEGEPESIVTQVVLEKDRSIKTYKTLEELGLVAPVTTLEVVEAMPNSSIAQLIASSGVYEITDSPSYGTIIIDRASQFRVVIEFTDSDIGDGDKFTGIYYNGVFSGYRRLSNRVETLSLTNSTPLFVYTLKKTGNVCVLNGSISAATLTTNDLLATVPAGARPSTNVYGVAFISNGTRLQLTTAGALTTLNTVTFTGNAVFNMSWVVDD